MADKAIKTKRGNGYQGNTAIKGYYGNSTLIALLSFIALLSLRLS